MDYQVSERLARIEAALESLAGDIQDLSVTMNHQIGALLQNADQMAAKLGTATGRAAVPKLPAGDGHTSAAMRQLADGVAFWQSKANWPNDFHNADYEKWAEENPHGDFNPEWWRVFRRRLWDWIAIRPHSYIDVDAGLERCRPQLTDAWHSVCEPLLKQDITTVTWEQVRAFPEVVGSIKPTRLPSPVFTSKFCHFLLPRIFPVVDNEAMKNTRTYEQYFRYVQSQWADTDADDRSGLIEELTRLINEEGRPVFDGFPTVNKIVELRIIGRCYPGMSGRSVQN